jgi:hypothetical protein
MNYRTIPPKEGTL